MISMRFMKISSICKNIAMLYYILCSLNNYAYAELADKNKPLNFEADTASYNDIKQIYHLNGDVVINKGSLSMKTNQAYIKVMPDGQQQAIATGGPKQTDGRAYVRQKRENLNEFIEAYGDKIEYNSQLSILKLIGNAKIVRLDANNKVIDEIQAPQMMYNSLDETYQAIGNNSNSGSKNTTGRVRATISPKL
jgi:lipopolysaccharide export system protein LptA